MFIVVPNELVVAVAATVSVIVPAPTDAIVSPAGIWGPALLITCPGNRPDVLDTVTVVDPLVV
jgi:hypothetical protein